MFIKVGVFRKPSKEKLLELARDNTQFLFNQIWELPRERVQDAICAVLPAENYGIPREKPVIRSIFAQILDFSYPKNVYQPNGSVSQKPRVSKRSQAIEKSMMRLPKNGNPLTATAVLTMRRKIGLLRSRKIKVGLFLFSFAFFRPLQGLFRRAKRSQTRTRG